MEDEFSRTSAKMLNSSRAVVEIGNHGETL
jgi:hypothetical protein